MNCEIFQCSRLKKRPKLLIFKKIIVLLLFLIVSFVVIFNLQIIPALAPFAKANATSTVTYEIQRIIASCINSGNYTDFVDINYDNNGNVVSIETNSAALAYTSSTIAENTVKNLCGNDSLSVSIPLGTLTGGALFAGRGPKLKFDLALSNKIRCNIENEFYESGINQTLHRIVANVEADVYILLPAYHQKTIVNTKYCLAETVIVGKVPDAYTNINRVNDEITESDIDDIFDFGAYTD